MKNRTLIGGLIAVGAAAGLMLSGLLPKFGSGDFGFGGGSSDDGDARTHVDAPASPVVSTNKKEEQVKDDEPEEVASEPAPGTATGETDRVLHVLIDGRQYLVKQAAGDGVEYQPVTVERLIELAKTMPGDDDGIRVRINRKGTSRVTAETALFDRLTAAGLSGDSIRLQEGLVE